jgi:hypothetical protein
MSPSASCPGPSRRQLLQVGAASLVGLSLPRLLAADARGHAARADACVIVFLNGGPSHLDMWDMKPDAPAEVRGPFKPIATTVPGVRLSEHLPRLARRLHRCTLVRSVHHSVNNAHAAAVYTGLTGHDRGDANIAIGAGPNDYPAIGSVVGLLRPPARTVVGYVSMPYMTQEGAGGPPQPGFHAGTLGRTRDPLFVLRDPNAPGFALPELGPGPGVDRPRLDGRRRLLGRLAAGAGGAAGEMAGFQGRAFDLLASRATQEAFRIDREPAAVRDRYGRNIYGQSVLLARRLIEAGTRVACISWAPDANATWDTHGQNFTKLKDTLRRRSTPPSPACSTTSTSAACWGAPWWRSWASSGGRRRSTPRPAETTGTSATGCCWPAGASRPATSTGPATASAPAPAATR